MPNFLEASDYTYLPQILKANGDEFSAMIYVRNYHKPYWQNYRESVVLGTNAIARTVVGDAQRVTPRFTVEAWGEAAYVEVMEAAWAVDTNGILTLKVPSLSNPSTGDAYSIICDLPPLERAVVRRKGIVQVFSADAENISVLGHESY